MQKTLALHLEYRKEEKVKTVHFPLPGLLHTDYVLALHVETRTLSLLSTGPQLIVQQKFSDNEIRVIVPILESFPHYCPYEVLLSNISSNTVSPSSVARCHQRLQEAQRLGRWPQELRPVRRALSSLRSKLHAFGLEISTVRERGCSLTSTSASTFSK